MPDLAKKAVAATGWIVVAAAGVLLGILFVPEPRLGQILVSPLIGLAAAQAVAAFRLGQTPQIGRVAPLAVLSCAFVLSLVLSRWFVSAWPNSGDEYGYVYLAETLLQVRLWNAPAPVAELFETYWIYERNGMRLSQYAPGWSVVLAPFVAMGAGYLVSPLALLISGLFLAASLKQLGIAGPAVATLTALTFLAPFALFNGASLFPMVFSGTLVLTVAWLRIRDEAVPTLANRVMIGLCFSVILTVRYEVFITLFPLYVLDRSLRDWRRFMHEIPGYLAGAAPLTLLFLAYNWAITGSPLQTTISWLRPGLELGMAPLDDVGPLTLQRVLWNQQIWFALLCAFGGLPLVVLYVAGFIRKLSGMSLRFYDFVPLSAVAFFLLFPDVGGHQFGPRYWFYGFAPMALTAAALPFDRDGWLRLTRWPLHGPTFATASSVGFLAMTAVVAPAFLVYANARQQVYDTMPDQVPAIVLVPSRHLNVLPWQPAPYFADSMDFTRNGTDFDGSVLYGRADAPIAIESACRLPGRAVYLWEQPGQLRRVACAG